MVLDKLLCGNLLSNKETVIILEILVWTITLHLMYEKSFCIQSFILQLLQLSVHVYAFM